MDGVPWSLAAFADELIRTPPASTSDKLIVTGLERRGSKVNR
jgi:hypothetical protein